MLFYVDCLRPDKESHITTTWFLKAVESTHQTHNKYIYHKIWTVNALPIETSKTMDAGCSRPKQATGVTFVVAMAAAASSSSSSHNDFGLMLMQFYRESHMSSNWNNHNNNNKAKIKRLQIGAAYARCRP